MSFGFLQSALENRKPLNCNSLIKLISKFLSILLVSGYNCLVVGSTVGLSDVQNYMPAILY